MPILDIQKRARELGRIRIGHQVQGTTRDGKEYTRPEKLDRFRLTSQSQVLLAKVAELYGGDVVQWTPKGGVQQWEVLTDAKRIPILVPPQPVSQWYEAWTAGGCIHRCDGVTDFITGEKCDTDSAIHQQAKPTTRLNVVLRDVEGVGVWRLESHGWNAAVELPNAAEFLAQVGGYITGWLSLEERTSIGENARTGKPETRRFMVPIIEIDVTPAELLAGKGGIRPQALTGGAVKALDAGSGDDQLAPYFELLEAAENPGDVMAVFEKAKADGILGEASGATPDHPLFVAIGQKGKALSATVEEPEPDEDGAIDAEVVDEDDGDKEALWMQCVAKAGDIGLNLWDLGDELMTFANVKPADATPFVLREFLKDLGQRESVKA